ncbi:MAG: arylsulfatase [Acidobacteria bacterium]|nr:arylsulfatase [Acidobacteriota bacterium]
MSLNRRTFLKTLSVLPGAAAPAKNRPNIVVILADDLGYGDVKCYNAESKIPTPNLDRLAAEGLRFTDAHTPCGVCSPTRYGLLTGRYPWRTELKSQVLWPWDRPLIEKGRLTLPGMLKSQGYTTAAIGKWHLGWDWQTTDGSKVNTTVRIGDPQREIRNEFAKKVLLDKPIGEGPTTRGFDYYFGVDLPNFPPYTFIENDRLTAPATEPKPAGMFGWPGMMKPGWKLEGVLPELTRRAVRYVTERSQQDQPYFLYLPLSSPHTPIAPDGEFKGKTGIGDYGDFVFQTDWSVGQVMDAIRASGKAANTLVIFTSDNGPENLTYPVLKEHGHASQGGLRGAKRMLWEGGHRVPYIVWGPGRVPAGGTSAEIVCHTDIMPAIAAITGYKLPNDAAEDGYDVSPAWLGKRQPKPIRAATVHHSINDKYAVRQGEWVYIDDNATHGPAEPQWWRDQYGIKPHSLPGELFHLKSDPREQKNLYDSEPARVKAMKALLDQYRAASRSVPKR